jgi:hypothetical protein
MPEVQQLRRDDGVQLRSGYRMKRPTLPTERVASIYETALWFRREYAADGEFFRMTDLWRWLRDEGAYVKIKPYKSNEIEDFKRKAGVIAFGDSITLVVDQRLMDRADEGCKLCNYMLAHEAAHLMLEHHRTGGVIKHFQLFAGSSGLANMPPTAEELEANYGAVFLQCGAALENSKWETLRLADRAFSDVRSVMKAQAAVQLNIFQRELDRQKLVGSRLPSFIF